MVRYDVQMIDAGVDDSWWNALIRHFVSPGDAFEIRCWREELEEVKKASPYGKLSLAGFRNQEVSIKGRVSPNLLRQLIEDKPRDKDIYNKMTGYFTINIENHRCKLSSAHYGTEVYLDIFHEEDQAFFGGLMANYGDDFVLAKV